MAWGLAEPAQNALEPSKKNKTGPRTKARGNQEQDININSSVRRNKTRSSETIMFRYMR